MVKCAYSIFVVLGLLAASAGTFHLSTATAQTPTAAVHGNGLIPANPEQFNKLPQTPTYRGFLPLDHVDLSPSFPPVGNQGNEGSCTAWAVGYAARSYYARTLEDRNNEIKKNIPSPAYIYNMIKGPGSCETGTQFKDAFELLEHGSLSWSQYPYHAGTCTPRPNRALQAEATDFQIVGYKRVPWKDLDQVKGQLLQNNPVLIGMRDTTTFHKLLSGETYDNPGDPLGYHALAVVGYDNRRKAFKVINSWDTTWADDGFGWIAYETFQTEVDEAYVMEVAPPAPPPPPPPTCSLSVSPASIIEGAPVTLSFSSGNATGGAIDNGIGSVGTTGEKTVSRQKRRPTLVRSPVPGERQPAQPPSL